MITIGTYFRSSDVHPHELLGIVTSKGRYDNRYNGLALFSYPNSLRVDILQFEDWDLRYYTVITEEEEKEKFLKAYAEAVKKHIELLKEFL